MNVKPRLHVTLEVEVELEEGGGMAEPEQIGAGLSDTLMDTAPYVLTEGETWVVTQVKFSADPVTCWYLPQSKVYHTNRLCTALNREDRYWPVQSATEPPKKRKLCGLCAQGGQHA